MKKASMLVGIVLISFFLISCALFEATYNFIQKNQKMPVGKQVTVLLTEADDGKEIQVTDGTYIDLTLPDNPTTGYEWQIQDAPGNTQVVVQHGEPDYVPGDPSGLTTGSGGRITYHFQALGLGKDTLVLDLCQDKEVAQTSTITIESVYPNK